MEKKVKWKASKIMNENLSGKLSNESLKEKSKEKQFNSKTERDIWFLCETVINSC